MEATKARPCRRSEFRVAIVCALEIESTAVMTMFDERWDASTLGRLPNDVNEYSIGRIGAHNVVLVYLPGMGTTSAAAAINHLLTTYENIELALMVGICGGVPNMGDEEIILGDVIISDSIVQFDFGSKYPHKLKRKDAVRDGLPRPTPRIRAFLHRMQTVQASTELQQNMRHYLEQMLAQPGFSSWKRPHPSTDKLFDPLYRHKHQHVGDCDVCDACNESWNETCEEALRAPCTELGCSDEHSTPRQRVEWLMQHDAPLQPKVHFGTVASANQVMKSAIDRDEIARRENAIAFEMEGAGLWEYVPTLIVKAVCDYADSHKSKSWQKYACAAAASYTKALLHEWTVADQNLPSSTSYVERDKNRTREIVDALWFRELAERFNGVKRAQFESFQWIFHEEKNPLIGKESQYIWGNDYKPQPPLVVYTRDFEKNTYPEWDPCKLKTWLRDGGGVFWITGKPGCGKSTLMKLIYEDNEYERLLRRWAGYDTLLIPAYFFWRAGSEMQKSRLGLFQSIVYQVFKSNPDLISGILEPVEQEDMLYMNEARQGSTRSPWTLERVQSIFEKLLQLKSVKTCILIDGLDEIEANHSEMAEYLFELTKNSNIKVLVSGRSISELSGPFQGCPSIFLHDWTRHDIEAYVRSRLLDKQSLREQADFSQGDFEDLIRYVLHRAEGVFTWVKTSISAAIDGIYKADSFSEVQSRLAKLPREMNDLYETILESLDGFYEGQSESLLSLILAAVKCDETLGTTILLATQYDKNPDWVFRMSSMDLSSFEKLQASTKKRLESRCSQFVTFTYHNDRSSQWSVNFVHRTVLDFLESPKMQTRLSVMKPDAEFYRLAIQMASFAKLFIGEGMPNPHHFLQKFSMFEMNSVDMLQPDSLSVVIRQLETTVCRLFVEDSNFRPPLIGQRYLCDYLSQICLAEAWAKYRKKKPTIALVCLMLYGDLAETARAYLKTDTCKLTTEERVDMLTIATLSRGQNFGVSNLAASNLVEDFFSQDAASVEQYWKKMILMLSCQADVSPVEYRLEREEFFAPNFYFTVETVLRLGIDPNVLVQCSLAPIPGAVLHSPLRVFRKCESYAKTVRTCYYSSYSTIPMRPGIQKRHVKEICFVIDTLLKYGAQDIEIPLSEPTRQPEEVMLIQKLKECKVHEYRREVDREKYEIAVYDSDATDSVNTSDYDEEEHRERYARQLEEQDGWEATQDTEALEAFLSYEDQNPEVEEQEDLLEEMGEEEEQALLEAIEKYEEISLEHYTGVRDEATGGKRKREGQNSNESQSDRARKIRFGLETD